MLNLKNTLSIQGGMACGKTTLTKMLEKVLSNVYFIHENPYPIVEKRKKQNIDIYTQNGFVENQRMFIEAEIKRYNNLPNGKIIFDRGPEDIEFYTLHFPLANGLHWDIENLLKDELKELRRCRSDFILYLDAREETLLKRIQNDVSRRRNSFYNNIKLHKFEKEWFNHFNTTIADVNNISSEQLVNWTLHFLKQINFL